MVVRLLTRGPDRGISTRYHTIDSMVDTRSTSAGVE